LGVLIVVAPEGADLVLATHIPNSEADVLVPDRETSNKKKLEHAAPQPRIPQRAHSLHGLNVEADGGNGGDLKRRAGRVSSAGASHRGSKATYNFTELELVQDGGLAGSVEPNHQNSHFLFGKQTLEQALEGTHLEESGSSAICLTLLAARALAL
jgi:hypothetical protein